MPRGEGTVLLSLREKRRGGTCFLSYGLVYLLVFAFVYVLGWAANFSKGLGVGEEADGLSKHVPEPK